MTWHTILLAETGVRKYLAIEPLFPLAQPWQWLILLALTIAALAFVALMYVGDGIELRLGTTVLLTTLRLLALVGLLVFFLNPVLRSERMFVKNSRVAFLIDTSISMGLRDTATDLVSGAASRIEQVARELASGQLISLLRREHDVMVYRFDQLSKPTLLAALPKVVDSDVLRSAAAQREGQQTALAQSRSIAWLAIFGVLGSLVLALGCGYLSWSRRNGRLQPLDDGSAGQAEGGRGAVCAWLVFASVLLFFLSLATMAVADLRSSDVRLSAILGLTAAAPQGVKRDDQAEGSQAARSEPVIDWHSELLPQGTETRLGDAIRYIVNKERGGPMAGIVVFTDGQSNEGVEYSAAVSVAADAQIPIYAVGMGGLARPVNVRIVDLEAPRRVYPGDKFTLSGLIQAYGLADRQVDIELVSTREDDADAIEELEESRSVRLAEDGKEVVERFEIESQSKQGRRIFKLRVRAPQEDHDRQDNEMSATVEVVARKNRVLLMAGGPTREFRFLRSQLYRDDETELFIWLQSGREGMAHAQGRETLWFEFPRSEDELFVFDCLIAFDPDWRQLTKEQTDLLERWISQKAGGMIVVAGPVYTPLWTARQRGSDDPIDTLRWLYPVSFFNQGSATIKVGRFGGEDPWPIDFTREGRSAEFLWLEDTAEKNSQAWDQFEGVFGYYAVNEPKPGATVFGRFSDPATAGGATGELPIYLAGQFYGAGRVFFQASGEMWRLRAVDETYFERYYTKLIRWVSQGRLLRDSLRGILLVDKDRCLLGQQIEIRAILTDAQHAPLVEQEVAAALIQPDGTRSSLSLRRVKDGAREGTFATRFTALQEGDYRIVLAVPDSDHAELLTRQVRVRIPDKEIERPQRHDALLSEVALGTGGEYFVGLEQANQRSGNGLALCRVIQPQDQTSFLPGTADQNFTTKLLSWLLVIICGVLASEWLMRRLNRLA